MSLDSHRLRSFLHVAELGSMSRAARRVNLSQPALSRHIALLESEVGVPLFERTGRGVRLTEAGRILAERAGPLLGELEQLASEVAARAHEVTGSVRVAVPPSVGVRVPAAIIERFRDLHPRVSLRVVVALSGAVHDGLLRGSLDLGILYQPVRSAALRTEPLWRESLLLVAPAGQLDRDRPVRLRDALTGPLVLPGPRHGLRALVERYAARLDVTLEVPVEVDALQLSLVLIRRGVGRALLPERAVANELAHGRLSVAPIVEPDVERTTLLAWPRERLQSRAASALADVLRDEVRRSGDFPG